MSPNQRQSKYYWAITNFRGQLGILGPHLTEADANNEAYEKFEGDFDIIPLETRNKSRATSIIKAKRLDATGDLEGALQRARHKF